MNKKIFLSVLFSTLCLFATAQSQTSTHVVQRGETIESIAQYYNVSVEDINKANPNADGMVYVGMKLVIPVRSESAAVTETQSVDASAAPQKTTESHMSSTSTSVVSDEGSWEICDEIGFGFVDGAKNHQYEATIGFNYHLQNNLYVGARIGYNSAHYRDYESWLGGYVDSELDFHFVEIPIEFGYSIKNKNGLFGIVPFVGVNTNIGISGKYKVTMYGESASEKIKIGGKVGFDGRFGVRVVLAGFVITGSFHKALGGEQKDWFGEDTYPEISIGYGF